LLERAGSSASAAGLHDQGRSLLEQAPRAAPIEWRSVVHLPRDPELGRVMLNGFDTEAALACLATATNEYADLSEDPAGVALWAQLARAQFLFARAAEAVATARCDAAAR